MTNWTLITGASDGLGAEFARIAAKDGQNVILTARSKDKLARIAEELRGHGHEVVTILADLNDQTEVDRLWAQASKDRTIDMVINNAGLGFHGLFAGNSEADWARELSSIDVNVLALTRLMKHGLVDMTARGQGCILNVASTAGFMPGPNMAVYHATKAYVLSLSEAVAQEVKGSGVTVTAFCPGATATNFFNESDMHGVRLLNLMKPADAHQVALAGWRAAKAGKRVAVPGVMNKIFALTSRVSPRSWVTAIAALIMGKKT